MKKAILTTALFLASILAFSQNAAQTKDGNFMALKTAPKEAKSTGKTFTDNKNVVYPVYETEKGKLFYIRVSKKTGAEYRQYLKIQSN